MGTSSTVRAFRRRPHRSARSKPSMIFAAVTFALAKNRPTRSSPLRSPPSRLRHTVLSVTIWSRIAPPFIEAQVSECPK
jgi:hypothetical protein